jgi:hypothetical protein
METGRVVDVSGGGRRRGWTSVRRNLGRQVRS